LSKVSTIPDTQLRSIVETAVKHAPSPFNIQSGRVVLLLGNESQKLWEIVKTGFLKTLNGDEAAIKLYTGKIAGHANGYGTILFFEDTATIDGIAAKMPALSSSFQTWSENSTGMLQFTVWTALAAEGMGASLQHYGGVSAEIVENIQKEWKLPSTWKSTAMMPFGVSTGEPRQRTYLPIEDRVKVFE